jgi:hypothetical protein
VVGSSSSGSSSGLFLEGDFNNRRKAQKRAKDHRGPKKRHPLSGRTCCSRSQESQGGVAKIVVLERVETGLLVQLDVNHSSQGAGIGSLVELGGEEVVGVKATDVVGGQSDRAGPSRVTPTHLEGGPGVGVSAENT